MKKKIFYLFSCGFLALAATAQTSPFTGSVIPAEGKGDYYLYQVESGKWIQNNCHIEDQWTTHAQLFKNGFDIEVIKIDGGYQLNPKEGNSHSINGETGGEFAIMDMTRKVTVWGIEPVTVGSVTNAYTIKALSSEELSEPFLLGEKDDQLSNDPSATNTTWQFITREERINRMKADAASGPVDATWLIPGNDFGRNDERNNLWTLQFISNGSSIGHNGIRGNAVREAWHEARKYAHYIVLKDIPNGTYNFRVQGYYRDTEVESEEYAERVAEGTEVLRAEYFAGAASAKLMPISKDASDVNIDGRYSYNIGEQGKWVPNSLDDASRVFIDGAYKNDWIKVVVTDNTMILGIKKDDAAYRDWLVYDNVELQYVSDETPTVDLTALKAELNVLITSAKSLPTTPKMSDAISKAESAASSQDATSLRLATFELQKMVNAISTASNDIALFNETKALAETEGTDITKAVDAFNNATNRDDFGNALKEIRYARRRAHAERHTDVFPGKAPAEGKFYLYNVGQKQFLCGGSDWGAHSALGFHGVELTLEAESTEENKYYIETGLYLDDKHYLSYGGYMDSPKIDDFQFIPVEGKENVFNIVQADYPDVHSAWNPYARVDQDPGSKDETTVGTECRNLDPNDPDSQWKLVTRQERVAMLNDASIDNPVDATFFIQSPGFNQRERANEVWQGASIFEYGSRHEDFVLDFWNTQSCDVNQLVSGLPAGVYTLSVQGYYRNGNYENQLDAEQTQEAYLYFGDNMDDEVALPNILAGINKAPGEGRKGTTADGVEIEFPDYPTQAVNFFKLGLYRVNTTITKADDDDIIIGIYKENQPAPEDWVVADNFRLTYWGTETTEEAVEDKLASGIQEINQDAVERVYDNRIFNLQGIEVTNPTVPGIYIQKGKKFIVR